MTMTNPLMLGVRVRFESDTERYPHFTIPKGSTGTVIHVSASLALVKLDETIPGMEEWDNEFQILPEDDVDLVRLPGPPVGA